MSVEQRPAFYALAPELPVDRLLWGLAAFALALGVGAHALDELNGRPLRTAIPDRMLVTLAVGSIGAATVIGVAASAAWTLWLLPFVAFGAFIVVAYSLELFGGRFHSDAWFALAWGSFPVLTAYVGATGTIRLPALLAAVVAAYLSLAQRRLSTLVRSVRRRAESVSGSIAYRDGDAETISAETLTRVPEAALRALTVAVVALAAALLALRL